MDDYKNVNAFSVDFVIKEDVETKKWKKCIKFCGEIDLGEFSGAFEVSNPHLNFSEMRKIVYAEVIKKIEKAMPLDRY